MYDAFEAVEAKPGAIAPMFDDWRRVLLWGASGTGKSALAATLAAALAAAAGDVCMERHPAAGAGSRQSISLARIRRNSLW